MTAAIQAHNRGKAMQSAMYVNSMSQEEWEDVQKKEEDLKKKENNPDGFNPEPPDNAESDDPDKYYQWLFDSIERQVQNNHSVFHP